MKKSLLALAVLGAFAGAASAQSSVTIYGSLDLAITKGNGGTAANVGGNSTSKAWIQKQSNGSRLGFRGNEDLGGGLSAQFQIEHRFTPDDGSVSSTAPFWAGRSYIQLSSATAGRIYLGRDYTPAFWVQLKSDPFGNDGVGQFGVPISWAGFNTPSAVVTGASARSSNTVGYKSPNLSGLTAQVAVGLGEGAVGRDTGFNVEYAAGPIYAGMGYEKITGAGLAPGANNGNSLINLAFSYDLGMVKPMLYYARAKLNAGTATPLTNKYIQIAASAPIGGGTLKVGYGRLDPQGASNTISKIGFGYDYPLSKRTGVYADVGLGRQDTMSNNTAYALGLKHTF